MIDAPFMLAPPLVVEVAGEPRGKGRPRFVRKSGRAFTPARTRAYEDVIRFAASQVMGQRAPLEGPLAVRVEAYFPVPASWPKGKRAAALLGQHKHVSRPDADNLIKVLDALNEIVWRDDSQIFQATIVKGYSDRPRLRVEVEAFL